MTSCQKFLGRTKIRELFYPFKVVKAHLIADTIFFVYQTIRTCNYLLFEIFSKACICNYNRYCTNFDPSAVRIPPLSIVSRM